VPAAPTTANAPQPVVVRGANGSQALAINESNGAVEIQYETHTLRGETRDSGKRKYHIDKGAVLFEVKPNDEGGFKLRTADGTLRWKVKVTPEKIKISDNR
jgi:hypothetical protein